MSTRRLPILVALLALLLQPALGHGQAKKLPAALAPTKVHLKFDDTPIDQAVAELSRKIGYLIFLSDPEGKLKNRKITLDTGEVTYWEAVEKLSTAGKLVEGIAALGLTPKNLPKLPPPPKPGEKIPLIKFGDGTPMFRTIRGVLVLEDGTWGKDPFGVWGPLPYPAAQPVDTATAVRVKRSRNFVPATSPGEITCALHVAPEPKLRWNDLVGIRIDRAVDDQGQVLQQYKKAAAVPKFGGSFGGTATSFSENGISTTTFCRAEYDSFVTVWS